MLTFADQPAQFAIMQVGRTETAVSHRLGHLRCGDCSSWSVVIGLQHPEIVMGYLYFFECRKVVCGCEFSLHSFM